MEHAKPRIVVSKCLGFARCRFNGLTVRSEAVDAMAGHVEFVTVCPEVEIGLGVPRDPVRIVRSSGTDRMVQPASGRDVTDEMVAFADAFLAGLEGVDGFILKNRSPSCGITDVKLYTTSEKAPPIGRGAGLFGGMVVEKRGHLAVEDEGRLTSFRVREHFLTHVFASAAFREVAASGAMRELVAFHARNKLLLMSYSQIQLRALGRIVANAEHRPWDAVVALYGERLQMALARPPRRTSAVNVAQHALGYMSGELSSAERAYFLDVLERYRLGHLPLSVPVGLLGAWVVRFGVSYLAQQTFFAPYPEALVEITDSGKGRDF